MNRSDYLKAISEHFYQGEVLGEAFFAACVALESDAGRRRKWTALLQLESETKARLRGLGPSGQANAIQRCAGMMQPSCRNPNGRTRP